MDSEWIECCDFARPLAFYAPPLARTNRDVVAIAEHGCGKTLAYAVPLLIRAAALQGLPGRASVVFCNLDHSCSFNIL